MTDLVCVVCRARPEPPVVFLDCVHSACLRHTAAGAHEPATGDAGRAVRRAPLVCTVCQTPTPCAPGDRAWVRDLLTEHLLERESRALHQASCENCNGEPPQWYCNTCTSGLCQTCIGAVHSAPIFRKHVLVRFGEHQAMRHSNWECTAHGKPVEFFDQETQRPACVACLLEGGGLVPRKGDSGKKKRVLAHSRSAQDDDMARTATVSDRFVPISDALRLASEDLGLVLQQGGKVVEELRRGLDALQQLAPLLAANYRTLENRIERTFQSMRAELEQQHADATTKTAQLFELKDKMLRSRQETLSGRLSVLETLSVLVGRLLALRDADAVVLGLKEFFVHQHADALLSLLGNSAKPHAHALLHQPVDLSGVLALPSVQLDWADVQSPVVSLQSQVAAYDRQLRSARSALRAVHRDLHAHRQRAQQMGQEVAALRQLFVKGSAAIVEWTRSQLQLLLRQQGAQSFPRRHARAALRALDAAASDQPDEDARPHSPVDPGYFALPADLEMWAEVRQDQVDLLATLAGCQQKLEQLQAAVQAFNRDVTVRRCRPPSGAVTNVVDQVRVLKQQVLDTRRTFNQLSQRVRPCWASLRAKIWAEENEFEAGDRALKDIESDGTNLAEGVEQLQHIYELLAKRTQTQADAASTATTDYLNEIKGVKPDSGRRLQAVKTVELEKEKRKKGNQMEDGLRDGIRQLRPTSGLRKVMSEEALGSVPQQGALSDSTAASALTSGGGSTGSLSISRSPLTLSSDNLVGAAATVPRRSSQPVAGVGGAASSATTPSAGGPATPPAAGAPTRFRPARRSLNFDDVAAAPL